jgi:aerobic-type carbon monoxide dehydrogenase small subunit (CoxS/CutS family)
MVEEVNGGDNSTGLANIDLDKRAVHIHGGMEHNLARCAKYYSIIST